MKKIRHLLPHKLDKPGTLPRKTACTPTMPAGFSCLVEIEDMEGKVTKYLFDTGWNYQWMDTCYKREGIDTMLANNEIAP